jgi:hypothetical protein
VFFVGLQDSAPQEDGCIGNKLMLKKSAYETGKLDRGELDGFQGGRRV